MSESFTLTVPYKGTEREIEVQLRQVGYTHRFIAILDGVEVYFEPDEERQYRAIIPTEQAELAHKIDHALLQAIAQTLHEVLS